MPFNLFRLGSKDKKRHPSGADVRNLKTTKRQWIRYPVEMPVELRTKSEAVNSIYGRALDVCQEGLGLLAACDLAVGQNIEVDFTIPQAGQRFKFPAEIRNRNGYRYGLQFKSRPGQFPSTFAEALSILR